jgi:hypothetical protein
MKSRWKRKLNRRVNRKNSPTPATQLTPCLSYPSCHSVLQNTTWKIITAWSPSSYVISRYKPCSSGLQLVVRERIAIFYFLFCCYVTRLSIADAKACNWTETRATSVHLLNIAAEWNLGPETGDLQKSVSWYALALPWTRQDRTLSRPGPFLSSLFPI